METFSTETTLFEVTDDLILKGKTRGIFLKLIWSISSLWNSRSWITSFDSWNTLKVSKKKCLAFWIVIWVLGLKVFIDGEYSMPRKITKGRSSRICCRSRSFFMLSCSSGSSVWTSWCQLSLSCQWHCYLFYLAFFYKSGGFWFDTYNSAEVVQ